MAKLDLVDVSSMDTTLRIELVYATENNFLGQAVYSGMTRAWLRCGRQIACRSSVVETGTSPMALYDL